MPAAGPRSSHAAAAAQAAHGPQLWSGLAGLSVVHGIVRRAGLICCHEAFFGLRACCCCAQDIQPLLRCAYECKPALASMCRHQRQPSLLATGPCARCASFFDTNLDCIVAFSLRLTRDRANLFVACTLTRATRMRVWRELVWPGCHFFYLCGYHFSGPVLS